MRFGILGDAKIARTMLLTAIRAAGHEIIHIGRRDAGQGPIRAGGMWQYRIMRVCWRMRRLMWCIMPYQIIYMSRGHCGRWQQESRSCVKSQLR